jgi:hypothetical protein
MKKLIFKMKNNALLRKILYWAIVAFLFLYTFSIPAFSGRPVWYLVSYALMGSLAGLTIVYTFLYTQFKFNRWLILPTSFVAFSLIGTIIYSHQFRMWLTLFLMLLTLVIFYYAFVAIENKRLIFQILLFSFLAFGIYFFIHYIDKLATLDLFNSRLGDYFDNENAIGFYFTIAYTLSLFSALFYKHKLELLFIIPTVLFLFLGVLTGSRAFILSVIFGSLFVLYIKLKNHKLIFLAIVICFIVITIILLNLPVFKPVKDGFDRALFTMFGIGNSKVDASTLQRYVWSQYSLYLGGKNALFGYGASGFGIFSGIGTYSHNNFGEVLCNFGIIGFILYYANFFLPLTMSIRKKDEEMYIIAILVIVYLLRSFFGVTYYAKEAYLVIALLFFLTKDYGLYEFKKKPKKVAPPAYDEVII